MKAAVIGAGAWGTTLAKILAENGRDVVIWSHDGAISDSINTQHENQQLFPGIKLPPNVTSTTSLIDAVKGTYLIVLVVASRFYAETLRKLTPLLGIVDGLALGDNARSALMVRGMAEMIRFGRHFGAKSETFFGLAGMGDLITTCSSVMSRNHSVGENLAKGKKLSEILGGMTAVAEGVETAKLVHGIAQKEGLVMPVTEQVYRILFEDKPVQEAIRDLMTRDLKAENA